MSIVEPGVSEVRAEVPFAAVATERWWGGWRGHALVWAMLTAVVGGAVWVGLPIEGGLRHWVFQETRPVRFREDASRGFYWGRQAVERGYLGLYGSMRGQSPNDQLWLDYAPLRLAVMTLWARVNASRFPGVTEYENTFEFAKPVLWVNTAIELFGAVGMFLLVRHWVIRHRTRFNGEDLGQLGMYAGVIPGLIASLLLWFNPAILLSAYGWPTWDVWIIPFYIWATYLASIDCWFLAGLAVAIGAMFKGQILAVAGIFVLWPLVSGFPLTILYLLAGAIVALGTRLLLLEPLGFAGRLSGAIAGWVFVLLVLSIAGLVARGARWSAVLRWGSGLVFGIGMIVSPWMLRHAGSGKLNIIAVGWILAVVQWTIAGMIGMYFIRRWGSSTATTRSFRFARDVSPRMEVIGLIVWLSAVLFGAIHISSFVLTKQVYWRTTLFALAVATGVALLWRRRSQLIFMAGVVGVALLLCMPLFNASDAWYICGWKFGTRHFDRLIVGLPDNIPALLQVRYGFENGDPEYPVFEIPAKLQFGWPGEPVTVTLKVLMKAIFMVTSLPCMVAAAMHYGKGDKRFLVAITTPWLLFFLFPLQIHERYLLFAAGTAACFVGVGFGPVLLHLFLSGAAFVMILNILENPGRRAAYAYEDPNSIFIRYGDELRNFCSGAHPDLAWAILLGAMILIFLSVSPSKNPKLIAPQDL